MQNLSVKELNYLKDLMSWELLTAKKCHEYEQKEGNASRKKLYADCANTHQQNYIGLVDYVDSIIKKQGGEMH